MGSFVYIAAPFPVQALDPPTVLVLVLARASGPAMGAGWAAEDEIDTILYYTYTVYTNSGPRRWARAHARARAHTIKIREWLFQIR